MAPARTGNESNKRKAVTKIDHRYNGIFCNVTSSLRKNRIVTMKLIAPNNEETPAIWRLNIVKSTEAPGWASIPDSGGYKVHPVPQPYSIIVP